MRALLIASFSLASVAFAAEPEKKEEKFKLIHVADVVTAQKKGEKVFLFDANGPDTRAKMGIVPGAVQLPKAHDYDLKVLPTDKKSKLVFYCANTH